jgi:hypothetical protein
MVQVVGGVGRKGWSEGISLQDMFFRDRPDCISVGPGIFPERNPGNIFQIFFEPENYRVFSCADLVLPWPRFVAGKR